MTTVSWISLYANLALIALVDAMSPVRVAVILVMLSGSRPVWRASAFIVGTATFNILCALLVYQFVEVLPTLDIETGALGSTVGVLLGIGLMIFAIRTWRTAPASTNAQKGQSSEFKLPAFVNRFSDLVLNGNIGVVFAGAMIMALFSLKSLILLGAALKRILEANIAPSSAVIALLFYVVVSLLEMIVPTIIFAASPDNSTRLLSQMSQWLLHYSYPILAIAEGAIAVYLIVQSIQGFLS